MRRPIPDQQASSPRQSLHLSRACVAASRSARCTIGKGASAGSCDRPLAAVDPEGDPDSDAGASTHPGDNFTSQRGEAPGSRILPPIESIVIRRSELTDNHETPGSNASPRRPACTGATEDVAPNTPGTPSRPWLSCLRNRPAALRDLTTVSSRSLPILWC